MSSNAAALDSGTQSVAKAKAAEKRPFLGIGAGGPKPLNKKAQLHMFRGMGSMMKAQINTADAVRFYAQGLPDKVFAGELMKVDRDVNAGISIHEAFRKTGRFGDMVIGLIQAGSDSGRLDQAFTAIAARFKSDLFFESQVKKATIMPAIVISILVGAFITAQVNIVPQVESMLSDVGQEPDGLTAMAFKVSHLTQNTWFMVVPAVLAAVAIIAFIPKVRNTVLVLAMARWRNLRLLVMGLRQATFLGTMELLYSNGINLAKAIRVSANSVKTTPFYDELRTAADKYEHTGLPLATAFGKYTSADDQVIHMLSIGERSASLDTQLAMLTEMLEEDTKNYMNDFTATLNFIVLIIAVFLIAAVFLGTFLPIFLMGPKMMQAGM